METESLKLLWVVDLTLFPGAKVDQLLLKEL